MEPVNLIRLERPTTLASLEYMLVTVIKNQEHIMTALQDLQAADAALKAEVATFLADVSTALSNAGSASDPAVEQVVSDINAEVAALQAGDPANAAPVAPAAPPAG